MGTTLVDEKLETRTVQQDIADALALIERANAKLRPEELSGSEAHTLMHAYGRIVKLGGFGVAALSPCLGDAPAVARASGTSLGKAREAEATGTTIKASPDLNTALLQGTVSLDQAAEIARAEEVAPGSARTLVKVAQDEAFHVLKDKARKVKLEAEQHRDLASRQHEARRARSHVDELGMVHIHLELEPHVGAPIAARAEVEAQRLARAARAGKTNDAGERVPFECHLADAYGHLLSGGPGQGSCQAPGVDGARVPLRGQARVEGREAGRGVQDPGHRSRSAPDSQRDRLRCVPQRGLFRRQGPQELQEMVPDIPIEVRAALELGQPPDFNGIRCRDCGNHLRTEWDHVLPRVAHGPASTSNLEPRCWTCHQAKTGRDRRAGKLRPP